MTGTNGVVSTLTAWRNRIIESRIVSAGELRHNPSNFRRHPDAQVAALRGLLNQVGIVAPLIAYHSERAGGALTLIDGEARDTLGGAWPCDILDVNDTEADLILSVFDRISGEATIDPQALMALLGRIEMTAMEDDGLLALLGQMAIESGQEPPDVEFKEYDESAADDVKWLQCPECGHKWPA